MVNFGLIGAAGYIAPRHIRAIKETGNNLVCATDPHDSVGILDRYFTNVRYFSEIERFDRYLEKLRRSSVEKRVKWLSICSPNYLHDAHIRMALRTDANALCEKPLVINPWNLDVLQELEREYDGSIFTVLQLRVHPVLVELKKRLESQDNSVRHQVELTYITSRGNWYLASWKGREDRSGGLALNIGIHFFDMLLWLFGKTIHSEVHLRTEKKVAGFLELKNADVRWMLSIDCNDLPFEANPGVKTTHRSINIDGSELEFTHGFTDLHTVVYENTINGKGFTLEDARPSIELVYQIRHCPITNTPEAGHPYILSTITGRS
ncbi:Gfo/Idh/MocA family oxidoreductase [bacterium]|nr:Gfo/Idh/MocA family oxidoreductase [bacterium]